MFAKLLKYDMKSTAKIGIPTFIAVLIAGIVGFFTCSIFATLNFFWSDMVQWNINVYLTEAPRYIQIISDLLMPIYNLSRVAAFFATFTVLVFITIGGTVILVVTVVNFYKSLLTDEGYLTFTLPVSPTTILCSKLTNSVIWNILVGIAQIIAGIAMFTPFIALSIAENIRYRIEYGPQESIPVETTAFSIINDITSIFGLVGTVITVVLFALIMIIATQLLYFFAVFLGGVIAKKQKLIVSAAFVVLAHIVFTTVQQGVEFITTAIIIVLGVIIATASAVLQSIKIPYEIIDCITNALMTSVVPISMILNTLIFAVIAIVLFILTNYLMKKKLNLP